MSEPPQRPWLLASRVLLLAAMLTAAALLWAGRGGHVPGCDPASVCAKVLITAWSEWQGIPVALLGLIACAGMLAGTWGINGAPELRRTRLVWASIISLGISVIGVSVWLIVVQALLLNQVCSLCMVAHACAGLAAIVLVWRSPQIQELVNRKRISLPGFIIGAFFRLPVMLGAIATAVIALGQPHNKNLGQVDRPLANSISPAIENGQRVIGFHYSAVKVRMDEAPVLGNPKAKYVAAFFFDYTCPDCRRTYGHLPELQKKHDLAILCLPVPLESTCNPQVTRTEPAHVNACEYAKIGLAVWRANPTSFVDYNSRFFKSRKPPTIERARQIAEEVVGKGNFAKALEEPAIEANIRRNVDIHRSNLERYSRTRLPVFLLPDYIVVNSPERTVDFVRFFDDKEYLFDAGEREE